jgi:hypothetical protein
MRWLEKDEQVHFITRKHPFFLLMSLLLPLLGFTVLVAAAVILGTDRPEISVPVLVGGFMLGVLWLAWNHHNWANDYYIITNHRLVWVEKVSGFYESRQEAPLGMVVSVGVQSTQPGRILGYADVVVRTIIGNIRFNRVADADVIEHLVDVFWRLRQSEEAVFEEEKMRATLRQKLTGNGATQPVQPREPDSLPLETDLPPLREKSFSAWEGPPAARFRTMVSFLMQSAMNNGLNPGRSSALREKNYFLISKNYCNLSVRLGYHYAMIEAMLGDRPVDRYITFRSKAERPAMSNEFGGLNCWPRCWKHLTTGLTESAMP